MIQRKVWTSVLCWLVLNCGVEIRPSRTGQKYPIDTTGLNADYVERSICYSNAIFWIWQTDNAFFDNFVVNGQWWHWHRDESIWPWRPTTRSTSHCSILTQPLIASSRQTSASRLIALWQLCATSWSNNDGAILNTDDANHLKCTEIWKSISEVIDCVGRWTTQWRLRIAAAAAADAAASGIDTVALRRRDWRHFPAADRYPMHLPGPFLAPAERRSVLSLFIGYVRARVGLAERNHNRPRAIQVTRTPSGPVAAISTITQKHWTLDPATRKTNRVNPFLNTWKISSYVSEQVDRKVLLCSAR